MEEMTITNAQYIQDTTIEIPENSGIKATIDGVEMFIPISEGNRHYAEIMRQVNAGTLTIQEADSE